ncbi:DM13 domain-containing protein [Calothrix sp. PCC 6303]|uniref:DM13 domain-containing protein n=1 Tax=Calothrix sp. PCC 6303 TaxID=1170562 RepID=UPI00059F7D7A|nr:DM13 domain-containing protein [Calothrix sp. PCC 6303]
MVIKSSVIPLLAIVFLVGCSPSDNSTSTNSGQVNPDISTTNTPASQNLGRFQAAQYSTQGNVRIVQEGGENYLEFDQSFRSDSGPDLFVILYRDSTVPKSGIRDRDYVNLAPLKSTSGNQRYLIPKDIQVVNYRSVGIWCRQFNTTFGFAPLS